MSAHHQCGRHAPRAAARLPVGALACRRLRCCQGSRHVDGSRGRGERRVRTRKLEPERRFREGSERVPRRFREGSEKRWFRVGRRRRLDAWSRVPRLERGARRRAQRQRAPRGAAARKCAAAHGAAWARQGHCLDCARRRRGRDHELLAMHRRGVTPAAARRARRARERSSDSRARQVGGLHALERR